MYIDKLNRRYLSPDNDGGGTTPFVSLEDIDEVTPEEQVELDKKKPNLEDEAGKQDAPKDDKKPEDEKLPEEKPEDKPEKKKTEPKEEAKPEDETTEEEEPTDDDNFWADVDKLRGEALEVDFGDVDPVSPEGVLIYEKAIRDDEIQKFEEHLKTSNPRAYAYLSHVLDGGKDEDFFKVAGQPVTLPTEAELENDVDLQKEIVTRNLKAKGNSDKQIERIIKGSIEDDDLEEVAKDALKEETKREADAIVAVEEQTKKQTEYRTGKIKEMTDYIDGVVATGKIDNITVPEKDRAAFAKAFSSSVKIENNEFVLVTPITNENITKLLKEKFFSHKNGDITDLIQKAAATANTKRLQRNIVSTQKKPLGNGQKNDTGITTLADMDD